MINGPELENVQPVVDNNSIQGSELLTPSTIKADDISQAIFYPKFLDLLNNKVADSRTTKKGGIKFMRNPLKFHSDDDDARHISALEDLYFAKKGGFNSLQKYKQEWGDESYRYESMLRDLDSEISQLESECQIQSQTLHGKKRVWAKLKAAKNFSELEQDQQERMIVLSVENDALDTAKKILASAALSVSIGIAFEKIGKTAAGASGFFPFASDIYDETTLNMVLGTTSLYYSILLLNSVQNLRLLQNPNIGTSMNVTETAYYHLAGKKINNRFLRAATVVGSGLVFEFSSELEWIGGLAIGSVILPENAPSAYIAGTLAGIVLNGGQAVAAEIWLKKHQKRKTEDAI